MATAKKTTRKASSKSASGKSSSTTTKRKSTTTKARTRTSATAHKTSRKSAAHSDNPSSTAKGKAKKEPAKQTSQCWPGYEPVPGKARGTKGSCKPKAHQTGAEKKSDGMAAAASKLRKAGGSKAKANHSK